MTPTIGKSINRNCMTGTEKPYHILFTTAEIGGAVSITNPLRTDTVNQTYPTIQPTIAHFKQVTVLGYINWNHFRIDILNSGIDVPRSVWNMDNHTWMNTQGPIMTTILESNITKNCDSFNLSRRTVNIAYRGLTWHVTVKSEIENLRGKCFWKC